MKLRFFAIGLMMIGGFAVLPLQAQDSAPIEIEFAHVFGGEGDPRNAVVQAIADDFMAEHPDVTVTLSSPSTDYTELFNTVLLSAEQGSIPEIVQVEEVTTQLAIDSGYFLPVADYASEEQLASMDDVLPVVRNYYTVDGKLWSLPWNSSNPVLYYNKTLTDALGIEISATDALTFDQILDICGQIMAAKDQFPTLTHCMNWPMTSWIVEQWMAMQNAPLTDNDNGRSGRAGEVFFDSEAMLNIVNWWQQMADDGYFTYSGTPNDYYGEAGAFLGGATALHINTTAGLPLFVDAFSGAGVDMGLAPLPIPIADATNGVTVGGASVWLTAGHTEAEQQAAVDFMFYLTSHDNDIRWHQGSGYFPNRISSIETLTEGGYTNPDTGAEESWFEAFPFFRVALDQLAASNSTTANAGAVIGPSADVRGALIEGIQSVIDGDTTPEDAMAAAKARADAMLADYNALVGS